MRYLPPSIPNVVRQLVMQRSVRPQRPPKRTPLVQTTRIHATVMGTVLRDGLTDVCSSWVEIGRPAAEHFGAKSVAAMVHMDAICYDRVSLSDDTRAREGFVVLSFLLPHFAVSMCAAAACTQETPDAERTTPPPPSSAIDPRLYTVKGEGGYPSRTLQSVGRLQKGVRRGTHPCLKDGCSTSGAL
jgi:hypothetical protein